MGEGIGPNRRPDWRNNQQCDCETFIDTDESGKWEPGEAFTDGNGNGQYDAETYHPSLTGYGPDPVPGNFLSPDGDLGLELILHAGNGNADRRRPASTTRSTCRRSTRATPIHGRRRVPREHRATATRSTIEKGDWLRLEPGRMTGPTNQGMQRPDRAGSRRRVGRRDAERHQLRLRREPAHRAHPDPRSADPDRLGPQAASRSSRSPPSSWSEMIGHGRSPWPLHQGPCPGRPVRRRADLGILHLQPLADSLKGVVPAADHRGSPDSTGPRAERGPGFRPGQEGTACRRRSQRS